MAKLLRIIYHVTINGTWYDIVECEILKMGHKVFVLRNETNQHKTRRIAKEDLMVVRNPNMDPLESSHRIWAHEVDLEEAKAKLKESTKIFLSLNKSWLERQLDNNEKLAAILLNDNPVVKRRTFEELEK